MTIKTATLNGVATIEIARPEKKNALTIAMYQAMADALHAAGTDQAVRAVLITGQPGVFTSGNDLEDFMQRPPHGEDSPVFKFMRALVECDKPVIAAVTGAAIGIGRIGAGRGRCSIRRRVGRRGVRGSGAWGTTRWVGAEANGRIRRLCHRVRGDASGVVVSD